MTPHQYPPFPTRTRQILKGVARHLSYSAAVMELRITQPAVNRAVADLQRRLTIRLFDATTALSTSPWRVKSAIAPSPSAWSASSRVRSRWWASRRTSGSSSPAGRHLELFLGSRLDALHRALGQNAAIRLPPCENDYLNLPNVVEIDRIDLIADHQSVDGLLRNEMVVFPEAIAGVCSPDFAEIHEDTSIARPTLRSRRCRSNGPAPDPSSSDPSPGRSQPSRCSPLRPAQDSPRARRTKSSLPGPDKAAEPSPVTGNRAAMEPARRWHISIQRN